MALLARHRYMIGKIADIFGYEDESAVEEMMLEESVLQSIDLFFTANGPTKILITYESIEQQQKSPDIKPQLKRKLSDFSVKSILSSSSDTLKPRLKVHLNEVEYLPTSAIYFMKVKKGNNEYIAIDPEKINDGALTYGVLREPLESFEAVMRCVYKPLIANMNNSLWGNTTTEQKSEFMQSIDMFTKGLQESIRSISGGIELKKPDERVEEHGNAVANDPALVMNSLNLLQDWCIKIEKYLGM